MHILHLSYWKKDFLKVFLFFESGAFSEIDRLNLTSQTCLCYFFVWLSVAKKLMFTVKVYFFLVRKTPFSPVFSFLRTFTSQPISQPKPVPYVL